jgi:hypothetical protein
MLFDRLEIVVPGKVPITAGPVATNPSAPIPVIATADSVQEEQDIDVEVAEMEAVPALAID